MHGLVLKGNIGLCLSCFPREGITRNGAVDADPFDRILSLTDIVIEGVDSERGANPVSQNRRGFTRSAERLYVSHGTAQTHTSERGKQKPEGITWTSVQVKSKSFMSVTQGAYIAVLPYLLGKYTLTTKLLDLVAVMMRLGILQYPVQIVRFATEAVA